MSRIKLENELTAIKSTSVDLDINVRKSEKEISQLNHQFKIVQEERDRAKLLAEKSIADADQANANLNRLETVNEKINAELEQSKIYLEELQNYSCELREDTKSTRGSVVKLQSNLDKLKDYSNRVKLYLDREKQEHQQTAQYAEELEKHMHYVKVDNEKLKSEVFKLKSMIKNVQTSIDKNTQAEVPLVDNNTDIV